MAQPLLSRSQRLRLPLLGLQLPLQVMLTADIEQTYSDTVICTLACILKQSLNGKCACVTGSIRPIIRTPEEEARRHERAARFQECMIAGPSEVQSQ